MSLIIPVAGFVSISRSALAPSLKIDENTKFDPSEFRNSVPRFSIEVHKANMALVDEVKPERRNAAQV